MFDCVLWAIKHDLPNIFDIGFHTDFLQTKNAKKYNFKFKVLF